MKLISLAVVGISMANPGQIHQLRNGQFVEIIEDNTKNITEKTENQEDPEKLEKLEKPDKFIPVRIVVGEEEPNPDLQMRHSHKKYYGGYGGYGGYGYGKREAEAGHHHGHHKGHYGGYGGYGYGYGYYG